MLLLLCNVERPLGAKDHYKQQSKEFLITPLVPSYLVISLLALLRRETGSFSKDTHHQRVLGIEKEKGTDSRVPNVSHYLILLFLHRLC